MTRRAIVGAAILAAGCMLAPTMPADASVPSFDDCVEGSDFIANAARARDNGVGRSVFVGRLEEDFAAIRGLPPALRWFVKDDDDERFLAGAAELVYDAPEPPERHRAAFLAACFARHAAGIAIRT
jgi:hypothetical protein